MISPIRKKIDYQKVLRDVAKSMVRLKRPQRLLKMIARFVDRELGLTHTSLLFLEETKERFVFLDSKGSSKLPMRLLKIEAEHPMVQWFTRHRHTASGIRNKYGFEIEDYLYRPRLEKKLSTPEVKKSPDRYVDVIRLIKFMEDFKVELVVPGYYKDSLQGLLLLGRKKDERKFSSSEISFFQVLAQDCSMAIKTAEYHHSLIDQNLELVKRLEEIEMLRKKERDTFYQIMRSLAQEVYAKDSYTFGHIGQVERLGIMTAKELGLDLSGKKGDILSAGLILHDVGKIGIPDNILKKPGPLNAEEWEVMKTHVEKGAKILGHLSDFREVAEVVHCHHERFDGSGYPRQLKGEQIPIESRIVSVVDAFHAIVSTRCYSQGRPVEVAFEELEKMAGKQFDPQVVEAFIRALKREMKKRGVGFFLEDLEHGQVGEQESAA